MNSKKSKKKEGKKNEKNLEYTKKINQIKEDYGVDFDIKYSKGKGIKTIEFYNLKYKKYLNIRISYHASNKTIDTVEYEPVVEKSIKVTSIKKSISEIEKKYKLHLIMSEIDVAYEELVMKKDKNKVKEIEENKKENENIKNTQISKND